MLHMKFSDQIRTAIRRSGLSRYRLAIESGVDEASLTRFLQGTGVTTTTIDALSKVLHLEVSMKGPRKTLIRRHGR